MMGALNVSETRATLGAARVPALLGTSSPGHSHAGWSLVLSWQSWRCLSCVWARRAVKVITVIARDVSCRRRCGRGKKEIQPLAAPKNNMAAHVTRHDQHDQNEVDRHAHW
jgi:hypothetical protein